jgi:hypothetical protein
MKAHLDRKRAARAVLLAGLLAAAGASSAWAALTAATGRGDITTDTTINWGTLGADFSDAGASPSVGAVTVSGAPAFAALENGVTFTYNFALNDRLLAMLDIPNQAPTNGNFVFDFATGIAGFGTDIQGSIFGALAVDLDVFDTANVLLGTFSFLGTSGDTNPGSALFVGVNSSSANIGRIVLRGAGEGAAVNHLSLDTIATTNVPEPGTLALAGLALAAAGTARRRRG